jgi:O-antigen/teichoic acid export membrane protein
MFKNIAANFLGRFWSIISNFLFLPLYIHILGFENYSIISFTLVIAGFMAFLDSGLTSTLSREFAKNSALSEKIKTFITLETIYAIIVALVAILIIVFAPFIVEKWINLETNQNVTWLIRIISFDIAFQMLLRFYLGGLLGLEKQVKANILQVFWGVFRNGLVLLVILFTPTLEVFFMWQSACTVVFALLYRFYLTKELHEKPVFAFHFKIDKEVLNSIWKFAGGMLLISLVAGINTQLDKMTISKLLPLQELGYYTLAVSLATAIAVLINPIAMALLPRFTSLFSLNKKEDIISLFKSVILYTY